MISQLLHLKRAMHHVFHGRMHPSSLPISEWLIVLIMWLISFLVLCLLYWKGNPPGWFS